MRNLNSNLKRNDKHIVKTSVLLCVCRSRSVPIDGLCVSNKFQVFVCHKGLPVIRVWDITKETLKAQIDVSSLEG